MTYSDQLAAPSLIALPARGTLTPLFRRLLLFAYVTDGSFRFALHHLYLSPSPTMVHHPFCDFPLHLLHLLHFSLLRTQSCLPGFADCAAVLPSRLPILIARHLCAGIHRPGVVAPLRSPHFISSLPLSLQTTAPLHSVWRGGSLTLFLSISLSFSATLPHHTRAPFPIPAIASHLNIAVPLESRSLVGRPPPVVRFVATVRR